MEFKEKQKFARVWFWLMIGVALFNSFLVYTVFLTSPILGVLSEVFLFLVVVLFAIAYFSIHIDATKITYRFFPLVGSQSIKWDEVKTYSIRKVDVMGEYRGWGVRTSLTYGKAYIISGETGLQLELNDGQKILLGIKDIDALKHFLDGINK